MSENGESPLHPCSVPAEAIHDMATRALVADTLLDRGMAFSVMNEIVDQYCNEHMIYPTANDPAPRQAIWGRVHDYLWGLREQEFRKKHHDFLV